MSESKFGIYLFGSESRGEAKSFSDVDLILLTTESITVREAEHRYQAAVLGKYPEWKNRRIDFCVAPSTERGAKLQDDVIILSYLHQEKARLVLGQDLLSQFPAPLWQDYRKAESLRVLALMFENRLLNPTWLFQKCLSEKRIRFLYGICFALSLERELLKKPGQWIFHAHQIDCSMLREVTAFVRQKCGYELPKDLKSLGELRQLCEKLSQFAKLKLKPGSENAS
jgi:predicted nucleotidyltransferase